MNNLLKKAGLGVVLAATAITAAAPAEAQWRRGGYYGRHYNNGAGTAVVAGIAGLAIGAAIASNNNDRYRDRYYYDRGYVPNYDRSYYYDHGYYPDDGYYAYTYRPRYERCYTERRWDRYYDRPVLVRVCN